MELLAALFVTAFVTGLSGAASPGPLLTWNIGAAARSGFWTGPKMVLGHAAVELPLVLLIAFGLGAAFRQPAVLTTVSMLGAVVLAWMSITTLRSVPTLPDPLTLRGDTAAGGSFREAFAAGMVVSVANPYWLLWWATIGAGLIGKSLEFGAAGLAVFFLGHISADLGWYGLVSFAVARGVDVLGQTGYRVLMAILGVALLVLSVLFLLGGLSGIGQ